MKKLTTLLILCAITLFSNRLQAQCSEIYLYRINGVMVSKTPIHLYVNGEKSTTIKIGDRYQATICAPGQYEFLVRTSDNDLVPSKVTINVEEGKNYYLKTSSSFGVDVASIKVQDPARGKKDIGNNGKFIGTINKIVLNENASAQTGIASNLATSGSAGGDQTFNPVHIVDNFKFEIVNMTKAGERLTIDYKITNLAADDRRLESCPNMMYFYDDLGNLNFAEKSCLANSCFNHPSYQKTSKVLDKYSCYRNSSSNAIMPSGIPLNGQIIIPGINKRATKFVRGTVWFKTENPFKLTYSNMEFPKIIDANNPNKRNYGNQSIELVNAVRDSLTTYVHFRHYNEGNEPYSMLTKGGLLYDDQGNQHDINALSLITKDQRVENHRYFKGWNAVVNPGTPIDVYAFFDKIPASASEIRRVTLTFEGFDLSWENIRIGGLKTASKSQLGEEYIQYSDFETKVKSKQNVIGNKVILENIYFSTGSAVILQNSYPQLNRLGELMGLNSHLNLEVSGHTDSVGEDLSNMLLSQKRADAIKYYLIGKSINPARITSIGKGENEPIRENTTEEGKKENRRVEILVVE